MVNVRELVLDMLLAVERQEVYSNIILKDVLDKYDYLDKDKAFIKRLFEGCIERRITLDYYIDCVSKTPVRKMKPLIRNLCRLTTYQIIYMDRIPDSAAINEAVKLAGKRGFKSLGGFVNGVLRNLSRQKDELTDRLNKDTSVEMLSVKYSFPNQVVDELIKDYGREETEEILKAFLEDRKLYIRIREDISAEESKTVLEELEQSATSVKVSDCLPYAVEVSGVKGFSDLSLFAKGYYTIMDLSSMFVTEVSGVKSTDRVLDMCGAPGGKTMHIASRMSSLRDGELGHILVRDLTPEKVDKIDENLERMNLYNSGLVNSQVWDATVRDDSLVESMDLVILDIPCSGFGVMGKKPDIRYNIDSDGLKSLEELQRQIIDNAVTYVKPGGTLVYSTCTLRKAENEKQADYILDNKGMTGSSIKELVPDRYKHRLNRDYELKLLPQDGCDGFYIARFQKEKR